MTLRSKDKRNETLELHKDPIQSHAEDTSANQTTSHEEIRQHAYEIYLERGSLPGNELDDWPRDVQLVLSHRSSTFRRSQRAATRKLPNAMHRRRRVNLA